jgi:NitT/TauT family transport system substrate-binding protein
MLPRRTLLSLTGAALATPALTQTRIPLKFSLNLPYNGTNLPFLYGRQRGFFAEQGFDVTAMDPASGSDATTRVASNTYDVAFSDVTSLADFYAQQPDATPLAVFNIFKTTPACIVSWKRERIEKPADLVGKTLGGPPTDNGYLLFPSFARVNGLDPASVKFENFDIRVREAMFMRREVAGVTGYDSTVWLNLKSLGVKFEDISILYYADYGLDLYSNSILVSRKFLRDHEAAIPALLTACAKCWIAAKRDPQAATAALSEADKLANSPIERERFEWVLSHQVINAETTRLGLGGLDPVRLQRNLAILDQTAHRSRETQVAAIWSSAYLPPIEQRIM